MSLQAGRRTFAAKSQNRARRLSWCHPSSRRHPHSRWINKIHISLNTNALEAERRCDLLGLYTHPQHPVWALRQVSLISVGSAALKQPHRADNDTRQPSRMSEINRGDLFFSASPLPLDVEQFTCLLLQRGTKRARIITHYWLQLLIRTGCCWQSIQSCIFVIIVTGFVFALLERCCLNVQSS